MKILRGIVCRKIIVTCAHLLQRVSIACYAQRCTSYDKSVRLIVCHTLVLCLKITQATIMRSSLEDSPMTGFFVVDFTANFQREHRERCFSVVAELLVGYTLPHATKLKIIKLTNYTN